MTIDGSVRHVRRTNNGTTFNFSGFPLETATATLLVLLLLSVFSRKGLFRPNPPAAAIKKSMAQLHSAARHRVLHQPMQKSILCLMHTAKTLLSTCSFISGPRGAGPPGQHFYQRTTVNVSDNHEYSAKKRRLQAQEQFAPYNSLHILAANWPDIFLGSSTQLKPPRPKVLRWDERTFSHNSADCI